MHNGLHVEILIDRAHPIGRDDAAGVEDVVLEAAITTIMDLEDSVAAVDAEDKVRGLPQLARPDAGARWSSAFEKGGKTGHPPARTRTAATRTPDGAHARAARPQPAAGPQRRPST